MKRNDFKKIIRLRSRWKITGDNCIDKISIFDYYYFN